MDFLTKKQIFRDFLCIRYSWKQLDLQLQIDSHFSNESLPREHVIRRLLDENFDADRIRFAACKSSCGTVTEVTEGKWPFCAICEGMNFYCSSEPQKFASEGIFFSIKREIRRIFNVPLVCELPKFWIVVTILEHFQLARNFKFSDDFEKNHVQRAREEIFDLHQMQSFQKILESEEKTHKGRTVKTLILRLTLDG